jgi:hypothetical protein
LDSSMKAFKERYGSYPPSDLTPANLTASGSVAAFLQKAFPRCNVSAEVTAIGNLQASASEPLSPAQALVFWLSGFSGDPEHPITGRLPTSMGGTLSTTSTFLNWSANAPAPLFAFDPGRLYPASGAAVQVYIPNGYVSPYVYFASQNYATYWASGTAGTGYAFANGNNYNWSNQGGQNTALIGSVRPYLQDNANPAAFQVLGFANPSSFQIISAGVDDDYGAGYCTYPSGVNVTLNSSTMINPIQYAPGDKDNLTNFSGRNLGDSLPQP